MIKIKRVILGTIFCAVLISGCGNHNSRTVTEEQAPERQYNENMTLDEVSMVTNELIGYSENMADIYDKMSQLTEKYADVITDSDTFDWSQYSEFNDIKQDVSALYQDIIVYDDSICSKEYQLCVDEFKSIATLMNTYFDDVSKEIDIEELGVLTQKMSNDFVISMNNASIYHTIAIIEYLEDNNGDKDTIRSMRASISDTYVYRSRYPDEQTSNTIFLNDYGTPTTKCAHSGCQNAIASSGDTNCCVIHSNKCFNCGKYIDEDAMFCMDCLSGNTTSLTDTGKYDSGYSGSGCTYAYFDGSICGEEINKYASLCDRHFEELYDTYSSFVGN